MGNIYCPEDLPNHNQVNCDDYFPGGISELIVFNSISITTDPTSASQVQSDLDAGRATHIKDIYGEMPAANKKAINTPRDNREIVSGFEFTLHYIDWNYTVDNVNFYDDLNYFRAVKILFYEPLLDGVGRASWVTGLTNGVSFGAVPVKPTADTEFQHYDVNAMWVSKFGPAIVDLPTGIFNQ